jgi:hypothetical protein
MGTLENIFTVDNFKKYYKVIEEKTHARFEERKKHGHFVHVFFESGEVHEMNFDNLAEMAERYVGNNLGAMKDAAYNVIGQAMVAFKCLGYIETFEAYYIQGSGYENQTEDEIDKKFSDMIDKHGKCLGDVPGRLEALMVCGRFKDYATMTSWKIERLGDLVILTDRTEDMDYVAGHNRSGHMWRAVDENTGLKVPEREIQKHIRGEA